MRRDGRGGHGVEWFCQTLQYPTQQPEYRGLKQMQSKQNDVTECGELCGDGTRCERRQRADLCYLHDTERDVPEEHGAPEGHTNSVTHGLEVETHKFIEEVLEPTEARHVFTVYDGLLRQSEYEFDVVYEVEEIDGHTLQRPVSTENRKRARDLLRAATGMVKQLRATATNVENGYLAESTDNLGYLNVELSELSEKIRMRMRRGGVSTD